MKISELQSGISFPFQNKQIQEGGENNPFSDVLQGFIKEVNTSQLSAGKMTNDFINGTNNVELHEVMIAGEKAKTSLDLLTEIRNKTLDMYRELSRMQ